MSGMIGRRRFMQAAAPAPAFVTSIRESGARTGYIDTGYTPPDLSSFACMCGNEQTASGLGGWIFYMYGSNGGATAFGIGGNSTTTWRAGVVRYDSNANLVSKNQWLQKTYASYGLFVTPSRFGVGASSPNDQHYTKGNLYPNARLILCKNIGSTVAGYDGSFRTFYVFGTDAQNETSYAGLLTHTPIATFRPCVYNGIVTMWHVEQNRPCDVHNGTFTVYEA